MDPRTLIPSLAYEDHPPEQNMMNAGLQEIVAKALNKDVNVLKEAAAEADKHRQETEKAAKATAKKPDRNYLEKERDEKLATHDTVEAGVLASGAQLLYDLAAGKIEQRFDKGDASHVEYSKKYIPGAKKMLFFTDEDGVRRGAWNIQLTMEEGNELERQEIGELLKDATSEEDKAYYTQLLTVLDEEKKAGRTVSEKQYDAGFLARLIGLKRYPRSHIDAAGMDQMKSDAQGAIVNNYQKGPSIRETIEKKYAYQIEQYKKRVEREEGYARKKAEQDAALAKKKTTKKK